MNLPQTLKYSAEHEWVKKEGKLARIGITDFAQSELGDIVFVELPEVGQELSAGEVFGNVESVKTVSELYAPVSGKVIEINESLEDSPEKVNESPYGDVWMIVIEMSNEADLDQLLSSEEYAKTIEQD